MAKCKLCLKDYPKLQEHHLIPQSVVNKVNKENNEIKKLKIYVCDGCHKEIHNAFITHLEMSGTIKGYNKMDAVQFHLLHAFLMEKNPGLWKEYKQYKRDIITEILKTMDDDVFIVEKNVNNNETKI